MLVAGASFSHFTYFTLNPELIMDLALYPLYNINMDLILDPRDVF